MNNTLIKGLTLLQLLAHSSRAQGVTELAHQMGVAKSHAHRLLQTLVEQGYARREEPGNYRISMRLWELGQTAIGNHDLVRSAAAPMQTLLELTRESVHLTVLEHREVVYVHRLERPDALRPPAPNGASTPAASTASPGTPGARAPAHCVATGKAMLAFLPPERLAAMAGELQRFTDATITDPGQFLEELAGVRRNGFAVNRGEWREWVCGIAAPIRDSQGTVVAAIGITGPPERFGPSTWRTLASPVLVAASNIGARLDLPHTVPG